MYQIHSKSGIEDLLVSRTREILKGERILQGLQAIAALKALEAQKNPYAQQVLQILNFIVAKGGTAPDIVVGLNPLILRLLLEDESDPKATQAVIKTSDFLNPLFEQALETGKISKDQIAKMKETIQVFKKYVEIHEEKKSQQNRDASDVLKSEKNLQVLLFMRHSKPIKDLKVLEA